MEDLLEWVAFHLLFLHRPYVGAELLARWRTPVAILRATQSELMPLEPHEWQAVLQLRQCVDYPRARRCMQHAQQSHVACITRGMVAYPRSLQTIPDPPAVLFVRGDTASILQPMIAIVGTRKPSSYGRQMAAILAEGLARSGYAIVSGLAYGIDAEAHRACVSSCHSTIAVLASGADNITPRGQAALGAQMVAMRGAICSEYPPGTDVRPEYYPRRNRLISGLSSGVIVVEGAVQSGTMWTARHAAEQGRLVFAVPGAAGQLQAAGPHALIRDGAILIESAAHVIEAITPSLPAATVPPKTTPVTTAAGISRQRPEAGGKAAPQFSEYRAWLQQPRTLSEMVATCGGSVDRVLADITAAEVDGVLRSTPRGYQWNE